MASLWERVRGAWAVLTGGAPLAGTSAPDRLRYYAYLDAWERGTVLQADPLRPGASVYAESLRQQLRLYRWTRLVWNPVPDLTDFWGSVVYPGALSRTGAPFPDGRPSAIPFPEDTKPDLMAAAAQIWWWSGMGHLKYRIPHTAAAYGNALVDIVDDLPGQKIVLVCRPPSYVRDVQLNPAGDVIFRSLAYTITPPDGRPPYVYREDITPTEVRTYYDDALYDYSGELHLGAIRPNEWGFVPACWVPHQPTATAWADPAIGAALPELLAINSLLSMLDDAVGRGTKPIFWFATDGAIDALFAGGKRGATADLAPEDGGREEITSFKLPSNATAGKLDPSINVADVSAHLAQRMADFHRHFPELSMWESLRQRDVSGVAAEILHGDTKNKAVAIRTTTDRQLEKATQMAITMAARRLHEGGPFRWRNPDARRKVFAPFTAASWGAGALDFTIADRPLVPPAPLSEAEKTDLAAARLNVLRLPPAWVYGELGVPEDVIKAAASAPPPVPLVPPPGSIPAPEVPALPS